MPTLTAFQPRPYIFPRAVAKIELVQALPEDLKEFVGYDDLQKKQYRLRFGLIYWVKSAVHGQIEGTLFIITENTDANQIKEMLDCKMIWISKSPFN
jgi:hypothetical protein